VHLDELQLTRRSQNMRSVIGLAVLGTFALGLTPAAASVGVPPAACEGRSIALATDAEGNPIEKLVEHRLYFHGETRSGNLDAAREFADAQAGDPAFHLTMNETAPTGADDKVFLYDVASIGSKDSAINPLLAHWTASLEAEKRIVCAQAEVFATTLLGRLDVQLWADKSVSEQGTPVTKPATGGAPSQSSKYTVNFGVLDFVASRNLSVQLAGPDGNAITTYDSTTSPGGFTYVTVEPI
jgi:hypothetical protein